MCDVVHIDFAEVGFGVFIACCLGAIGGNNAIGGCVVSAKDVGNGGSGGFVAAYQAVGTADTVVWG